MLLLGILILASAIMLTGILIVNGMIPHPTGFLPDKRVRISARLAAVFPMLWFVVLVTLPFINAEAFKGIPMSLKMVLASVVTIACMFAVSFAGVAATKKSIRRTIVYSNFLIGMVHVILVVAELFYMIARAS